MFSGQILFEYLELFMIVLCSQSKTPVQKNLSDLHYREKYVP